MHKTVDDALNTPEDSFYAKRRLYQSTPSQVRWANTPTDDSRVVELVEDADTTEKQEEVQPEAETQETPVL